MSVANDIRAAVVAVVNGLGLSNVTKVEARKRPYFRDGDATTGNGLVTVSVDELGWEPFTAEDDSGVQGTYRLVVGFFRPTAAKEVAENVVEEWMQATRRALYKPNPLPTVTAVSMCEMRDAPQFTPAALDKNYDFGLLRLIYETIEVRN